MIEFFIIVFIGYLVGRAGDYLAGHWDFFHHWVYGILFIIAGLFSHKHIIFFGIGLVISDFKDSIEFKIYGPDEKEIKKFWGID